jgi:TRAP-type transport system small permease protein
MSEGLATRISFVAGATGLLAAMGLDAAAVVGRHVGYPLLGSIELIRAAVVIAASSALVGVTLGQSHAAIHLLTERLPPLLRARLARATRLLCAAFFAWLAAGSIWVTAELWDGAEASELLAIPYKPLRLFWCGSVLLVFTLFVRAAFERAALERP